MSFHQHHPASHRRPVGHRRRPSLRLLLISALVVAGCADALSHLRSSPAGTATSAQAGPLPSITLSGVSGQSANRLAIDISSLRSGHDLFVPIDVTNAGNRAVSGVAASLVSSVPGLHVAGDAVPVGPGATVRYRLHLTDASSAGALPQQVVIAVSSKG